MNNNSILNNNNINNLQGQAVNGGNNVPSNIMLLSGNRNILMPKSAVFDREQAHKEAEFLYQGLTHLKPFIVDFLKNVYIFGEGSSSTNYLSHMVFVFCIIKI